METVNIEFTKDELERELIIHAAWRNTSDKYKTALKQLDSPKVCDRVAGWNDNDKENYITGLFNFTDGNRYRILTNNGHVYCDHVAKIKKEAEF